MTVGRATSHGARVLALCATTFLMACGGERGGVPRATVLSSEGANQQLVRFSPDGKQVAYWQAGPGVWKLTVASADLTGARTLDSAAVLFNVPPAWSPDGAKLAYLAGSDLDIWVVSASGGPPRRLTTGKGIEQPVQWQPHGDRLAYVATGKGGAVGSGQVDIATGATGPIVADKRFTVPFWSPDGSKIAYMVVDGSKTTLWVADSTGRNADQLTREGFEQFSSGAGDPWSPDGSQILYESRRTGFADVWTVSVTTDSLRQLTRDVRNDYAPQWSPDGQWVAFLSDRGRQTDIWIVPAAGGTPERVTDNDAVERDIQWVPGTREIGFTSGVVQRGLWTHALADGSEHRVTPDSIRVGAYDVSPDRESVAFVNVRGGGVRDLDVIAASGGAPRTLVSNGAVNTNPQWSPDGSKVLYLSDKTGTQDVWVVDAAGGEPTDATPWPTDEHAAAWSKDGDSIYVVSSRNAKPLSDLWEVSASGGEPRRITQSGTVQDVIVSGVSGDVLVRSFAGSEGQVSLSRLLPSGRLQTLWDRSSVMSTTNRWFTPSGDSVAFLVQGSGGSPRTMLVPTHGGEARPFLDENQGVGAWSPDGTKLVYWAPIAFSDLYLKSLPDGKTQRLTNTPDDEGGVFWLPGGQRILFYRASRQQRIATVDVGGLMAGERR